MSSQQAELSGRTSKRIRIHVSSGRENYFGETIRELRQEKQVTQGEAARMLGVTQSQWCSYENGTTRPHLDIVLTIAHKFNIEPVILICKSIDRSRFADPVLQLTFQEYKPVENYIENYRQERLKEKVEAKMEELRSYIAGQY